MGSPHTIPDRPGASIIILTPVSGISGTGLADASLYTGYPGPLIPQYQFFCSGGGGR